MEKPRIGIHIFRRDLRIEDNINLDQLSENVDMIVPVFLLSKHQIITNRLRNDNFVQFMLESLEDLDQRLGGKLLLLNDFDMEDAEIKNLKVISDLLDLLGADVSYMSFMSDYTLYSKLRDEKIKKLATDSQYNIKIINSEDTMLNPVSQNIRTDTGKVYQKFTPYYNKVTSQPYFGDLQRSLHRTDKSPEIQKKIDLFWDHATKLNLKNTKHEGNKFVHIREMIQKKIDFSPITSEERKKGGRTQGLSILKNIREKKFKNYETERDYPAKSQTTRISAYLKMGCLSIREVAKTVLATDNMPLFRELIWRDFYYSIAYHFPHVLLPFNDKNYNGKRNFDKSQPRWKNTEDPQVRENLEKWKTGQTGFPIVDAGMRQLNSIGWMHNRIRMVVASFLIKDLGISWQEGEKYFAEKLIDYDPCQNNGGWQWTNGTGVDSQPYNRIFNPWEQAKKWDPQAEYIKYWVPELSFYPNEAIFNWDKVHEEIIRIKKLTGKKYYFPPMVNHSDARKEYLDSFS